MAGESSKPPGLKPGGTVKNGDCPTNKFIGRLCPKFKPPPLPLPSDSSGPPSADVLADGDAIAPARSWEKERHSDSESSAKKLETRVMGPGLASAGSTRKKFSTVEFGGREIDGLFTSSAPPSPARLFFAMELGLKNSGS